MTHGVFITGTDTGVGKSLVACAFVKKFKLKNLKVVGMKPVASGSAMTGDGLRNDDATALQSASNVVADYSLINPYCFEPAIAPHLAARLAGVTINLAHLKDCYQQLATSADVIVVEGAGGWKVPLETGYISDFPEMLALDVILVVGMRLGCLNHALLTAQAIADAGKCCLAGWVANVIDPGFAPLDANLDLLMQRLPVPCLGVIPYLPAPNPELAADVLDISMLNPRQ